MSDSALHMKDIDIAYIAGLFDGEGDVGIYSYKATKNGKRYPKLTARIHNTNKQALDWTREKIGFGLVCADRKGVKESGNAARKQCYVYIVAHRMARNFLKLVQDYLIIKKDKVACVLLEDNLYMNRKNVQKITGIIKPIKQRTYKNKVAGSIFVNRK